MEKIYAGQSALRITVKTFTDSAAIKYRKPDGPIGEFTAGLGYYEGGDFP
jgi:hypothetical protein